MLGIVWRQGFQVKAAFKLRVWVTAGLLAFTLFAPPPVQAFTAEPVLSRADSTCDITGTVLELRAVERSPWTDGTPTTLAIYETHIQVSIHKRRPHRDSAPAESPCRKPLETNELRTYKLCSSSKPKRGDRITGTEGGSTGSTRVARCLFDLVVLNTEPKKN